MLNNQELLSGGREGKIYRDRDKVIRPCNLWTPYVHKFLEFLNEKGFYNIPKPCGINENEEIVSFVQGEVYNYPLPDFMLKDEMIISAAALLRSYHNVGEKYVCKLSGDEEWMLPAVTPIEVMCHGDFAPYNVTVMDGNAVGIIDFDTLHPGSRLWDIAYAIYRWVPFVNPENPDCYFRLDEQIVKAKLFLDTYGVPEEERKKIPQVMSERLNCLVGYMRSQSNDGNEDFERNINDGHLSLYLKDVEYILDNEKAILDGIIH